jgi:hypothetical protein
MVRVRFGPVRRGGFGKVAGDGAERLDDQVEQTDQQRPQPVPAAVGDKALRDLGQSLGEAMLGGWGGLVHAGVLVFLTYPVKSKFRGRLE